MQGLIAKLSATPGVLRWAGRTADADGPSIRSDGWDVFGRLPAAPAQAPSS